MKILLAGLAVAAFAGDGPASQPTAGAASSAHIAEVGQCIWDHLRPEDKSKLLAAAETQAPMQLAIMAATSGQIDTYGPTRLCDPDYSRHPQESNVALRAGIAKGIAEARLSTRHITREQLDAVWAADPALRETMTSMFRDPLRYDAHRGGSPSSPEKTTAAVVGLVEIGREALPRLGLRPAGPLEPGAPEFSAMSYWMARGLEAAVVDL
jgi:hypothetical protein